MNVSVRSVLPNELLARIFTTVVPAAEGVPVTAPELDIWRSAGRAGPARTEKLVAPVATTW